jgi:hypothetical protein
MLITREMKCVYDEYFSRKKNRSRIKVDEIRKNGWFRNNGGNYTLFRREQVCVVHFVKKLKEEVVSNGKALTKTNNDKTTELRRRLHLPFSQKYIGYHHHCRHY